MAKLQEGVRQQQLFIDRWMEGGLSVTENIRILGTIPTASTSHCNRHICFFLKNVRLLQGPPEKGGDQRTGETSFLLWSSTEKPEDNTSRRYKGLNQSRLLHGSTQAITGGPQPWMSSWIPHQAFLVWERQQPKLSLCLASYEPKAMAWDRSPSLLNVTGSFPAGWKCLNGILWSSQLTVPDPSSSLRETP